MSIGEKVRNSSVTIYGMVCAGCPLCEFGPPHVVGVDWNRIAKREAGVTEHDVVDEDKFNVSPFTPMEAGRTVLLNGLVVNYKEYRAWREAGRPSRVEKRHAYTAASTAVGVILEEALAALEPDMIADFQRVYIRTVFKGVLEKYQLLDE